MLNGAVNALDYNLQIGKGSHPALVVFDETGMQSITYEELLQRDKVSLDITWLRDESLEDMDNLPPPEVIAQEIVEDLEAALAEFAAIAESLGSRAEKPE